MTTLMSAGRRAAECQLLDLLLLRFRVLRVPSEWALVDSNEEHSVRSSLALEPARCEVRMLRVEDLESSDKDLIRGKQIIGWCWGIEKRRL